jgi:hypothetical protein
MSMIGDSPDFCGVVPARSGAAEEAGALGAASGSGAVSSPGPSASAGMRSTQPDSISSGTVSRLPSACNRPRLSSKISSSRSPSPRNRSAIS